MASTWLKSLAAALASLVTSVASASYLYEPLPPVVYAGGFSLDSEQALGVSFALAASSTISGVEIYVFPGGDATSSYGQMTVALHAGNPDGAELFHDTYSFTTGEGWLSSNPLSWSVGPGTYSLTFENANDDGSLGATDFSSSENALLLWYRNANSNFSWTTDGPDSGGIGVRISGQVTAVPEPETYVLLAAGLLTMSMFGQRRRRQESARR